ncbi:pentapeptide repeat-containing protein [Blastococcus sp. SYSU DS0619]
MAGTLVLQIWTLTSVQSNQAELERQIGVAQRFSVLAEQLSSDAPIERIAGLYGLRELANDQESARVRSIKIIAAYLKTISTRADASYDEIAVAGGQLAGISRLASDDDPGERISYDLAGVNLASYSLRELHVDGGYFPDVVLSGAGLEGATITCTRLTGADLRGADLSGATVSRVLLDERSDFSGTLIDGDTEIRDVYWIGTPGLIPEGNHAGGLAEFERECEL